MKVFLMIMPFVLEQIYGMPQPLPLAKGRPPSDKNPALRQREGSNSNERASTTTPSFPTPPNMNLFRSRGQAPPAPPGPAAPPGNPPFVDASLQFGKLIDAPRSPNGRPGPAQIPKPSPQTGNGSNPEYSEEYYNGGQNGSRPLRNVGTNANLRLRQSVTKRSSTVQQQMISSFDRTSNDAFSNPIITASTKGTAENLDGQKQTNEQQRDGHAALGNGASIEIRVKSVNSATSPTTSTATTTAAAAAATATAASSIGRGWLSLSQSIEELATRKQVIKDESLINEETSSSPKSQNFTHQQSHNPDASATITPQQKSNTNSTHNKLSADSDQVSADRDKNASIQAKTHQNAAVMNNEQVVNIAGPKKEIKSVGVASMFRSRCPYSIPPADVNSTKCAFQLTKHKTLDIFNGHSEVSMCETMVPTRIQCELMCAEITECRAIHFCPECVERNCRLLKEPKNGPSGLALVDRYYFVDYSEKEKCTP